VRNKCRPLQLRLVYKGNMPLVLGQSSRLALLCPTRRAEDGWSVWAPPFCDSWV